jgi:hypothetical protein
VYYPEKNHKASSSNFVVTPDISKTIDAHPSDSVTGRFINDAREVVFINKSSNVLNSLFYDLNQTKTSFDGYSLKKTKTEGNAPKTTKIYDLEH